MKSLHLNLYLHISWIPIMGVYLLLHPDEFILLSLLIITNKQILIPSYFSCLQNSPCPDIIFLLSSDTIRLPLELYFCALIPYIYPQDLFCMPSYHTLPTLRTSRHSWIPLNWDISIGKASTTAWEEDVACDPGGAHVWNLPAATFLHCLDDVWPQEIHAQLTHPQHIPGR